MPKQWKLEHRIWVHAGKDTDAARDKVCSYQDALPTTVGTQKRVPITDRPTVSKVEQLKYGAFCGPVARRITSRKHAV